ncbi:MAG: VOC family protein [Ktedonobacteraceae bacterium]|nr:VOC family protein [Ktedonobacteraceae bacterium]
MMKFDTPISIISVLVADQEEALHFYTQKLDMEKRTDMTFGPGLRLLTVAPRGQHRPEIALAQPDAGRARGTWEEQTRTLRQRKAMPWVFDTDDCRRAYEILTARGVNFIHAPVQQPYGIEAVFEDPYGNTFVLLEASPEMRQQFESRRVGTGVGTAA